MQFGPIFPAAETLRLLTNSHLGCGANRGNWTRAAIDYFPDAEYTLIEPQDALKVHVHDLIRGGYNLRWISAGAGNQAGTLPLYIALLKHASWF